MVYVKVLIQMPTGRTLTGYIPLRYAPPQDICHPDSCNSKIDHMKIWEEIKIFRAKKNYSKHKAETLFTKIVKKKSKKYFCAQLFLQRVRCTCD